jgi:hypothetical protein
VLFFCYIGTLSFYRLSVNIHINPGFKLRDCRIPRWSDLDGKRRDLRVGKEYGPSIILAHSDDTLFHIREDTIDIFGEVIGLLDIHFGGKNKNTSGLVIHIFEEHYG